MLLVLYDVFDPLEFQVALVDNVGKKVFFDNMECVTGDLEKKCCRVYDVTVYVEIGPFSVWNAPIKS